MWHGVGVSLLQEPEKPCEELVLVRRKQQWHSPDVMVKEGRLQANTEEKGNLLVMDRR